MGSSYSRLFRPVEQQARAEGKGEYFRLHRHRYLALLAALDAAPGARVLEVGVTPGQLTHLLVRAGYRVSGVDLNPGPRRALWRQLGVQVCQMNLERQPLPFASESFERVVFSEVLEHLVYSPLPALREFRRVLKPGGRLLLTTPNELYLKSRLHTLVRMFSWKSRDTREEFRHQMLLEGEARYTTHSRTYTMDEVCWLVEQAGLRVVQRRYEAAWERVGVEVGRLWKRPQRVVAKGVLAAITGLLPPTRSMLLVVAERRTGGVRRFGSLDRCLETGWMGYETSRTSRSA
ncbi:MAG: class I SAM-dependent methyltransferase, partial [Chloroflexaceae bacterium]|nr:class I SAM-dependent methyltransferase [Chloroflexaceae bacterium]